MGVWEVGYGREWGSTSILRDSGSRFSGLAMLNWKRRDRRGFSESREMEGGTRRVVRVSCSWSLELLF